MFFTYSIRSRAHASDDILVSDDTHDTAAHGETVSGHC